MPISLPVKPLHATLTFAKEFVVDRSAVAATHTQFYIADDSLRAWMGFAGVRCDKVWPPKTFPTPFALPAATLTKAVASFASQGVETLTLSEIKDHAITVRAGRFRSKVPVLTDHLNDFMFADPPKKMLPTPTSFWTAISRVLFSVCPDETKPGIRGVFWHPSGMLFSSDAMRITILTPPAAEALACPVDTGFLLPDDLLSRLGPRLDLVTAVALTDTLCWMQLPDAYVFGPGIAVPFPVESVINAKATVLGRQKKKAGTWVKMHDDLPLDLVLGRLLDFADPPERSFEVTVETKGIVVRAGGRDGSPSGEEVIPAEVNGPKQTFLVDGKFFAEACKHVSRIFWTDHEQRNVIAFASPDKQVLHLIMLLSAPTAG